MPTPLSGRDCRLTEVLACVREQSDSISEFGSIYARELARKGNYTSVQIKASLVRPLSVSAGFFTSFRQTFSVKTQLLSREHLVDVPDGQKVGPPRSMARRQHSSSI